MMMEYSHAKKERDNPMKIAYVNATWHIGNGESFYGSLVTENGRITALVEGGMPPPADEIVNLGGYLVIPGLVDVHTHGRAGYDFTSATLDGATAAARSYLSSGVTSFLPTLASAPFAELCAAGDTLGALKSAAESDGTLPRVLGVHLEGRYLSKEKRGAHAEHLLAPLDPDELKTLIPHLGTKFHVSCAPECDKTGEFIKTVTACGGTVGIAHTTATYVQAMVALNRGAVSFTHTYNAMPALRHREGGAVAAALVSDAYAELICDGLHVSPEMVHLAYKCKGNRRLVLITDSMEATDVGDGTYSIAGMTCIVKNGKAMTTDGHLAGSTLSLLDALVNLMHFCNISLDEALPTATRNPAEMVRASSDVGTLEVGKMADFIVLPHEFDAYLRPHEGVRAVVLGGRRV